MILEDDFLETCRPQVTFIRPTAKKRYVVYPDHSELDVLKQGIIEKNKGGYEFLLIIVLLHISDIFATSIKVSLFGVLPLVRFFVSGGFALKVSVLILGFDFCRDPQRYAIVSL